MIKLHNHSNSGRKSTCQNSTFIHDKNSHQNGYRGIISQHNKAIYDKPKPTSHLTQWMRVFPLNSGTRQEGPLSLLLCNIVVKVLATAVRQEKEIKFIQIEREEVKLLVCIDDMI